MKRNGIQYQFQSNDEGLPNTKLFLLFQNHLKHVAYLLHLLFFHVSPFVHFLTNTRSRPKTVIALSTSSILSTRARFSLYALVVYKVTLVCVILSLRALYSESRLVLISLISSYLSLMVPCGLLLSSIC